MSFFTVKDLFLVLATIAVVLGCTDTLDPRNQESAPASEQYLKRDTTAQPGSTSRSDIDKTMPTFLNVRWGANAQEVKNSITGTQLVQEQHVSSTREDGKETHLLYRGGSVAGHPIDTMRFIVKERGGFWYAHASVKPSGGRSQAFSDLQKHFAQLYGPPDQGSSYTAAWTFPEQPPATLQLSANTADSTVKIVAQRASEPGMIPETKR